MNTAAAETDSAIRAQGRKDADKQEAVITMEPVKEGIEDLVQLYVKAGTANDRLNDAIKATAEKAGLLASVVRKFVVARAGEKWEEEHRKVNQLALVFDEVGNG